MDREEQGISSNKNAKKKFKKKSMNSLMTLKCLCFNSFTELPASKQTPHNYSIKFHFFLEFKLIFKSVFSSSLSKLKQRQRVYSSNLGSWPILNFLSNVFMQMKDRDLCTITGKGATLHWILILRLNVHNLLHRLSACLKDSLASFQGNHGVHLPCQAAGSQT